MSSIAPLEMNLSITRAVYEGRFDNPWIQKIQAIAIATLLPVMMIAAFEALSKFFVFSLLNISISVLNTTYDFLNDYFRN